MQILSKFELFRQTFPPNRIYYNPSPTITVERVLFKMVSLFSLNPNILDLSIEKLGRIS